MRHRGPRGGIFMAGTLAGAMAIVGCGTGLGPTSIPGTPGAATPGTGTGSAAPTLVPLDQLSLTPAIETPDPALVRTPDQTPPPAPPAGPPEGVPPPPPEVTLDYTGPADDLAGFIAAYRQAFGIPEAPDEAIAGAGARLCTYLQRQATANGSVDLGRVITEADINEPGYPREVWQQAFEIATAHYCGEFSFAPGTEG